jgi:hypothetical protein
MSTNESDRKKTKLETSVIARNLAVYTIRICTNEKNFDPKYRACMTDKIISDAIDIFRCTWTANNIRVTGEEAWKRREQLQKRAVQHCNDLLALINLAKQLFHITTKGKEYWIGQTIEVRNAILGWHDSDRKRYKGM